MMVYLYSLTAPPFPARTGRVCGKAFSWWGDTTFIKEVVLHLWDAKPPPSQLPGGLECAVRTSVVGETEGGKPFSGRYQGLL